MPPNRPVTDPTEINSYDFRNASRSLPKRKSLIGLFGPSLKRSLDRLKSHTTIKLPQQADALRSVESFGNALPTDHGFSLVCPDPYPEVKSRTAAYMSDDKPPKLSLGPLGQIDLSIRRERIHVRPELSVQRICCQLLRLQIVCAI